MVTLEAPGTELAPYQPLIDMDGACWVNDVWSFAASTTLLISKSHFVNA